MKHHSFIFFLLLTWHINAQSSVQSDSLEHEEDYIPWKYGLDNTMVGIHVMPMSLGGAHPRLRLGINVQRERWAFVFDFEYGNEWIRNAVRSNTDLEYRFVGIRPEVRYSLSQSVNSDFAHYIALEFPVNAYRREVVDGEYDENGFRFHYDYAVQKRWRNSILLKTGSVLNFSDRFYGEVYSGIGVAFRNVRYEDFGNVTVYESLPNDIEFDWGQHRLDPGRKSVVDLAFGLRLGYFIVE